MEQNYVERLREIERSVKELNRERTQLLQEYKYIHGIAEGTKVKLTRKVYNLEKGSEEQKVYYLFIDSVFYDPTMELFKYKFKDITPLGKPSKARCGIYHLPRTDKIEKI